MMPSSSSVNTTSEPGKRSHVKACAASSDTRIVSTTETAVTNTLLTK